MPRGKPVENSVLLELHKAYRFKIIKKIEIPSDQNYFLLQDPFEYRHLLPEKFYINYGLENQNEILCYVDKINCSGRIFLDPEHPYYRISEIYQFPFYGKKIITTRHGDSKKMLVVKDIFNNECYAEASVEQWTDDFNPAYLYCRVVRIKKARLMLEYVRHERE